MGMWKNLIPIKDRLPDRVTPTHAVRLREVAARVCSRTGCVAWFDALHNQIAFGFQPNGIERVVYSTGVFKMRVDSGGKERPVYGCPDWLQHATGSKVNEDDIVYSIMLARVPQEQKDKWKAEREKVNEDENKRVRESKIADSAKEGLRRAESEYNRYTMGRHHKGFAQMSS